MKIKKTILDCVYVSVLMCGFCFFSAALDPQGPLAFSMTGSGRAVVQGGAEYHLLNPAEVIHSTGFSAGAYYIFSAKNRKPVWGVSLSENRHFPLAFSYIKQRESEEQYFSMSTAGFITPGWSLGLSVSRWQTVKGADWNIQSGVLIKPKGSAFSLGAVWDHILPLKGAFENKRRWAFGMAYKLYEELYLRADALYNKQEKWQVAGGVEGVFSRFLVLRFSGGWHFTERVLLFSGGIGVETKQISLDYGLSQLEKEKYWLHTINARLSF